MIAVVSGGVIIDQKDKYQRYCQENRYYRLHMCLFFGMKGIIMNRKNRKLFSGILVAILVLAMLVPMLASLL